MTSKNAIKLFSLFLFCLVFLKQAEAQDTTKVEQVTGVKSLNKIRLTFLGLTYEREQKVGKLTSVYFAGGAAATFTIRSYKYGSISETNTYFNIFPTLNIGIRQYYNFEQRNKKGKKTVNNAANYYGLDLVAYFNPLLKNNHFERREVGITPHWGFQRSLGKKVNFELMLGPTARLGNNETYFGVDGRIGFSFLL